MSDIQVLLLVVVAIGGLPFNGATYPDCDEHIVEKIKESWGGKPPANIIKTADDNGKEVVIATSEGYYPADTKCVFSVFTGDKINISTVPNNGDPRSEELPIKEDEGKLVTESNGVKVNRYHVFIGKGVTAFYTCIEKGDSETATTTDSPSEESKEESSKTDSKESGPKSAGGSTPESQYTEGKTSPKTKSEEESTIKTKPSSTETKKETSKSETKEETTPLPTTTRLPTTTVEPPKKPGGETPLKKTAAGAIKVKASGYEKAALEMAKEKMGELGITLSKVYPEQCEAIKKQSWLKKTVHNIHNVLKAFG